MANKVILTEQERNLVFLWRAYRAYMEQRRRGHALLDDPSDADDEFCWIELFDEGSGTVFVKPSNPNEPKFKPAEWADLPDAAVKVAAATVHLRLRIDQVEQGRPRFGNPRRGRPAKPPKPS